MPIAAIIVAAVLFVLGPDADSSGDDEATMAGERSALPSGTSVGRLGEAKPRSGELRTGGPMGADEDAQVPADGVQLPSALDGVPGPVVDLGEASPPEEAVGGRLESGGVDLLPAPASERFRYGGQRVQGRDLRAEQVTDGGVWVASGDGWLLLAWGELDPVTGIEAGDRVAVEGIVRIVSERDTSLIAAAAGGSSELTVGDAYVHALVLER